MHAGFDKKIATSLLARFEFRHKGSPVYQIARATLSQWNSICVVQLRCDYANGSLRPPPSEEIVSIFFVREESGGSSKIGRLEHCFWVGEHLTFEGKGSSMFAFLVWYTDGPKESRILQPGEQLSLTDRHCFLNAKAKLNGFGN